MSRSTHDVAGCRCFFFDAFAPKSKAVCAPCFDQDCSCVAAKQTVGRFEAIEILMKINTSIEAQNYAEAFRLAGISEDLFDGEPLDRVTQAFEVRLADLMKIAGIVHD